LCPMDALEALVLGIVQGITEWLPVSSSGHLVISQELLGLSAEENLVFDLVVHLGTVLAVCAYFRRELARIVRALFTSRGHRDAETDALRRLGFMLLLGTVPVAVVGLMLADKVEELFDLRLVGAALLVNALMLFAAERVGAKGARKDVGLVDTVTVGFFQAASIVPGISRSGWTIAGGMFRGLEKEMAATFAFLLSVPTLLGAFAYGAATLDNYDAQALNLALGFAAAFATGVVSIRYLLKAVRAQKLWVFGAYCALLGVAVVVFAA
jgi:undecaprenyl-diphosphatase